ncbi:hypothetical protein PENTCL1PPCAC_7951, partial [Pristionchus entomophagus]
IFSVVLALSQMDSSHASRLGLMTLAYYTTTALIAASIGIFFITTIQPGTARHLAHSAKNNSQMASTGSIETMDTVLDLLRNMFPDNIFKATFKRVNTQYERNGTNVSKELVDGEGTNILGILVFCMSFGLVTSWLGNQVRVVIDLFIGLDAIIRGWINALMWFAPVGIFSLVCGNLLGVD